MPLIADDFLSPKGELEPALFPQDQGGALTARLTQYIADGTIAATAADITDPADVDAVVREYVYVRAYDAILLRYANTPNTSIADEGSISISSAQIDILRDKRGEHQIAFDALIEGDELPASGSAIPPTTSGRIIPTW